LPDRGWLVVEGSCFGCLLVLVRVEVLMTEGYSFCRELSLLM